MHFQEIREYKSGVRVSNPKINVVIRSIYIDNHSRRNRTSYQHHHFPQGCLRDRHYHRGLYVSWFVADIGGLAFNRPQTVYLFFFNILAQQKSGRTNVSRPTYFVKNCCILRPTRDLQFSFLITQATTNRPALELNMSHHRTRELVLYNSMVLLVNGDCCYSYTQGSLNYIRKQVK